MPRGRSLDFTLVPKLRLGHALDAKLCMATRAGPLKFAPSFPSFQLGNALAARLCMATRGSQEIARNPVLGCHGRVATEAEFWRAVRVTLTGSMTPALTRSS